ncbi:RDD family protein [Phytohabitans sp. ZYX-F-186]|uniref:RDD family protein n=1 Tax=Phytohabitans maris TaxID=3071409 RepID=A0ABU0ZUE5_9ACTN|nr:RDD family protein [Phytohabitans sp. ZYX-F-186]MDQ7910663.1 RDD family protein [Phytohabitans sp. ZYX-F-186]
MTQPTPSSAPQQAGWQLPPPPWAAPALRPPPPPPAMSPAGQPLATFTDRLLAYLIDYGVLLCVALVLAVPAFVIFFLAVGPDLFEVRPDGTPVEPSFVEFFVPLLLIEIGLFAVLLVVSYVYYVEILFRSGQTLGKRVMKIKIVALAPDTALTRRSAAKRWLVAHVATNFVPGFLYLDGLWQLWDKPHQQCLHDKFAATVVVKVPA